MRSPQGDPTPTSEKRRFRWKRWILGVLILAGLYLLVDGLRYWRLNREWNATWEAADAAYAAGDWEAADRHYSRIIRWDRSQGSAFYFRGVAHALARDFEGATDDFAHSAWLGWEPADSYARSGTALFELGRLREAEADFERALDLDPNNLEMLTALARVQMETGDFYSADETMARAIEAGADPSQIHAQLAWSLQDAGDLARAMDYANHAIKLDPVDESAYLMRADLRLKALDFEGAIEDLDRVIQESPENAIFLVLRAIARLRLDVHGTLDLEPPGLTHQGIMSVGMLFDWIVPEGDKQAAISDLTRAVSLDPTIYLSSAILGVVLFLRGDFDEAVVAYRRAIEALESMDDGPPTDIWAEQARFDLEQGRYAFAILDARYILTKEPQSKVARYIMRASARVDNDAQELLKQELRGPLGDILGADFITSIDDPLPATPPPL